MFALIAQWIERRPPKLEIEVRLLVGAQERKKAPCFHETLGVQFGAHI